jgi:hypothetical protein
VERNAKNKTNPISAVVSSEWQADDWGELPTAPKVDKLDRLLQRAGISPTAGSPLSDPLFMPSEQSAERRSIREQLRLYQTAGPLALGAHDYITLADGRRIAADKFYENQNRLAYELLLRNVDHRSIAARTHLDVSDVAVIAERYHLK